MDFVALIIFAIAFVFIVFEPFDKSLTALMGALLMIFFGVISPHEAIMAVEFETILLLLGMMMLVHMTAKSGILAWINVKIASFTRGSPFAIFLFFSLLTAVMSAFLDNVTTVIIMVPLTIALLKGMGRDPKMYVFSEVLFSNIGGALTLIGDPPNIIIGGATGFGFVDFIVNLWIPISITLVLSLGLIMATHKKAFCSISHNLTDLHLAYLLIEKIKRKFLKITLQRWFIIKALTVLLLTIIGFFAMEMLHHSYHDFPHIPPFVIAMTGAILLGAILCKQIDIHGSFQSVEWSTLFFFAGLFVMVAGVEKTGILDDLSHWVATTTDDLLLLSLLILWVAGFVSMILDNIPFVTVMLPVVAGIQETLPTTGDLNTDMLWWALSLGACLGGNGTLIGASANVVSADLARKNGVEITFLGYMRFAFPLTILSLVVASGYLFFVIR